MHLARSRDVSFYVLAARNFEPIAMSSRHLHPLSVRLPRAERNAVVAFACSRGVSISSVLKTALRRYLPEGTLGVDTHSQDRVATALDGAAQGAQSSSEPFGAVDLDRLTPGVSIRAIGLMTLTAHLLGGPGPNECSERSRGETGKRRAAFSMTRVAASRPRACL